MDKTTRSAPVAALLVFAATLLAAAPAKAIPAFARKYGTSCVTCHTIYPHLTPFGEAFRRNGFKFPGKDADFVKQEVVSLGQDAYKSMFPRYVWPGVLAESSPLALGFNGQATIHPDKTTGAAQADNGTIFTLHDLVAEGHLWAGGSFDSNAKINYWGEITFSTDGTIDIEHAALLFNDLFGPAHLFNIIVGRGVATLTSFAPHSSYVSDTFLTPLSVTGLFGASEGWNVGGMYNGVEINGMAAGRFIYSIGVNAGDNHDVRPTENAYAHVGFKVGGMRLDGEGDYKANPDKPWAETALTVDLFGYRAASHTTYTVNDEKGASNTVPQDDLAWTVGGSLRLSLGSFELNSGVYNEWHNSALQPQVMTTLDPTKPMITPGGNVTALAQFNELSYIVYPWFVPAVRVEYLRVTRGDTLPDGRKAPCDATMWDCTASEIRIIPGVAFLVRPNLKLTVTAMIEHAIGTPPDAGWAAANGSAMPGLGHKVTEVESITAGMAFAF